MAESSNKIQHLIIEKLLEDRVKLAQSMRGLQKISKQRKQALEKQIDRAVRIEGSDSALSKRLKERHQYEVSASKFFSHAADRLANAADNPTKEIEDLKAKFGIE